MNIDEILRQAALIVADELDAGYRLFLFGSRAKGTGNDKSDIDIGIISDNPLHQQSPVRTYNSYAPYPQRPPETTVRSK